MSDYSGDSQRQDTIEREMEKYRKIGQDLMKALEEENESLRNQIRSLKNSGDK